MPSSHPHGRPVTIMKFSDTGDVEVDYDELEGIFNHEEIQDRKVVIISLIGAFRGGKSYLLNYCLRFLYANYSSINKPKEGLPFFFHKKENWMGSKDDPLKGFSWRSGIERDTVGINMWSDVFLHTIESTGEKIAIFIMDTQGLFDNNSSTTENSRIFALSSLIASAQVLNLANRIQEDHLQHLQFSTEYTQFTALNKKDSDEKPFQDLMFLVRDWNDVDEYAFGKAGGMEYLLKEVLAIDSQRQELFSVRESIMDSFEHFACYLLPHPGKTVAGSKNYDGRWSEMDDEFKDELQNLVECLLIPDNLVIKKINSENVSVMDMHQYIKDYFELFRLNHDPEVSSIYELTIERYMNNLIKACIDEYKHAVYSNRDLLTDKSMETIHENCKKKALEEFDEMKKMGNSDHEKIFKIRLSEKIDKIYNEHKEQSESNERRIEDEMNDQIKQLEKEQLLRKEAEQEKELAQNMLRSLKEMLPEDDDQKEELKRQIKIAEERIKAAKAVIEKLNKKEAKNKSFRKYLVAAVGGAVVVGLKVLVKAKPCSIM